LAFFVEVEAFEALCNRCLSLIYLRFHRYFLAAPDGSACPTQVVYGLRFAWSRAPALLFEPAFSLRDFRSLFSTLSPIWSVYDLPPTSVPFFVSPLQVYAPFSPNFPESEVFLKRVLSPFRIFDPFCTCRPALPPSIKCFSCRRPQTRYRDLSSSKSFLSPI